MSSNAKTEWMPSETWWLEQTEAELPQDDDWLGPIEVKQLQRFKFRKRRRDWRLGRWTAKLAVATYLQVPMSRPGLRRIEIRPTESGAPEAFLDAIPAPIAISISHSADVAMCALASPEVEVGCDVEIIEPHEPALVSDYFTGKEQALLAKLRDEESRKVAVTLVWSAKESAMKALKQGLQIPTQHVSVHFDGLRTYGDEWKAMYVTHRSGRIYSGWWQRSDRFVRTVVRRAGSAPIRLRAQFPAVE